MKNPYDFNPNDPYVPSSAYDRTTLDSLLSTAIPEWTNSKIRKSPVTSSELIKLLGFADSPDAYNYRAYREGGYK